MSDHSWKVGDTVYGAYVPFGDPFFARIYAAMGCEPYDTGDD